MNLAEASVKRHEQGCKLHYHAVFFAVKGTIFMPQAFKEWWKGHTVFPCPSVCPSPSAFGVSNLHLSFSGGGIRVLWTHFYFSQNLFDIKGFFFYL